MIGHAGSPAEEGGAEAGSSAAERTGPAPAAGVATGDTAGADRPAGDPAERTVLPDPPRDAIAGGELGDRFHVVVIGAGPVGKTALINALLGRSAGETGATIGTTRSGRMHTYTVEGVEGMLLLTDTPGRGEAGPEGVARETEALDLACRADLVLFVVDHDLTRADRQTLLDLSRLGKRLIVVLNKKDRFTADDREAILTKLRERLQGFVPHEDIV